MGDVPIVRPRPASRFSSQTGKGRVARLGSGAGERGEAESELETGPLAAHVGISGDGHRPPGGNNRERGRVTGSGPPLWEMRTQDGPRNDLAAADSDRPGEGPTPRPRGDAEDGSAAVGDRPPGAARKPNASAAGAVTSAEAQSTDSKASPTASGDRDSTNHRQSQDTFRQHGENDGDGVSPPKDKGVRNVPEPGREHGVGEASDSVIHLNPRQVNRRGDRGTDDIPGFADATDESGGSTRPRSPDDRSAPGPRARLIGDEGPRDDRSHEASVVPSAGPRRMGPDSGPGLADGNRNTPIAGAAAADSVVRITIGRVDIRAISPAPSPPRPAQPPSPRLRLEEYLRRRGGGG